jgi:hypothetical protein
VKLLKVFALFFVLHALVWAFAHVYRSANPEQVLVVVDTSFAMKSKFPQMLDWIEDFERSSRYRTIMVGTDKAEIGKLSTLKSKESIFRTVFGKMEPENLQRYAQSDASRKYLLSDGSVQADGWTLVRF